MPISGAGTIIEQYVRLREGFHPHTNGWQEAKFLAHIPTPIIADQYVPPASGVVSRDTALAEGGIAMKHIVAVLGAALCLCACVAQNMNQGLAALMGQDIHAAVNRLGYPDAQREMLGDKIYIWGTSRDTVLPMSTTNFTNGMVGTVPVYGTTTSTSFVPVNFNCTIQISTNAMGVITSWHWSGNMGGCSTYANALKPSN